MGSGFLPYIYILMAGGAIYWTVSILFSKNEDMKALSWASGTEPEKSKSPAIEISRSLTHQFTIQWAVKIKSVSYRKRLSKLLMTSGMSAELNEDEFIGMQMLWGVLFPIVLIILNFALQYNYNPIIFILFAAFGWQMPHLHAKAEREKRQRSVRIDLPFFIDLMALATEAGLDFQGAIQRIVERTRGKSVLADEMAIVLRDITLGSSRAQALRGLSARLDMQEVSSFVNVVVDADSTGTSISTVLKDQSAQMRVERFVRAEKAGAQASQKILIPLMLFILPAVFIMVFAPVALNFMYGKK
ncbi:MAG TPA: type II secretion system F family protein [Bdellovibrionales bacterium]|nr:type II secretion system F family protein [Bdellovibrionales bacterium]